MKTIVTMFAAFIIAAGPVGAQAGAQAQGTVRGGHQTVHATSGHNWNPATSRVSRGTKVVWKNPTNTTHTVTAYGGGWSKNTTLHSGDHTSFTFNSSGTFKFRCTIHSTLSNGNCSGMCGKVVVS
jgi:plastocyanin